MTFLWLSGCAIQPRYETPEVAMPGAWSNIPESASGGAMARQEDWWTRFDDPAIDSLVESALLDNPTLSQAAARVDEARAAVGVSRARRAPHLNANGSMSRGASQAQSGSAAAVIATSASLAPSLSWELDLWGRARASEDAARSRLDARGADAEDARLSLIAQIADSVVALRACNYSLAVRSKDIASREIELSLIRQRLSVGNVSPVDEASASSDLFIAQTNRSSQEQFCTELVDSLVALSGREANSIRSLVPQPSRFLLDAGNGVTSEDSGINAFASVVPSPPSFLLDMPATVLRQHPSVRAAERELAASYAEIGVARADRLPRVDLSALLTGQWIRAWGSTTHSDTWSIGGALAVPIFDGGLGSANVEAAEARYRASLANLEAILRTATRDVEDSLAALSSSQQRADTSTKAVDAALVAFHANEASYRAGAVSLFELEGSRRRLNAARESAITAASDRARSWISLVRAAGNPAMYAYPSGQSGDAKAVSTDFRSDRSVQ
ncbi:efflux transporter outer membrane subunit [Bordetella genomosp. 1]|nr:efflux transporter outer membrane subunit [Bordetella genomosp. 1]